MNDFRRVLKRSVGLAANQLGVPPRVYHENVRDFLMEEAEPHWTAQQYAAKAIDYLCPRDKSQIDMLICLAAVRFLDETVGAPPTDDRNARLRDLGVMINQKAMHPEIEKWADVWYP